MLQLTLGGVAEEDSRAIARPRAGGVPSDNEAEFENLWRYLVKGWAVSKARLSENYSYEDFRQDKPVDAMKMLIMNEKKDVEFTSSQRMLDPEAGDTIVCSARAEHPQTSETADAPFG